MEFIKKKENEWWELDRKRQCLFNYDGGYYYIKEEELNNSEIIECKNWNDLYNKTRFCPLEIPLTWGCVWISPDGLFYNGDAHDNRAEEILEIIYNETDILWSGDRLEELGWVRASSDLMWKVRMDSNYWDNRQVTQKQYDSLWDWCKKHNKSFPENLIIK